MKYFATAFLLLIFNSVFGQTVISPRLQHAISENPELYQKITILLKDRFDIILLDEKLNLEKADQKTRVKLVVSKLQEKARATQPALIDFLNSLNEVKPGSVHSLWITNMIYCTVKASFIKNISQRTDIQSIDINAPLRMSEYKNELNIPLFFSPQGAEPGLKAINADKLWALGYSGYGRVAYVADTGIDPTHPAYINKARSLFVPQSQAWFDMDGSLSPTDCGDHGSHCLGTILGLDRLANDTVGVAFNAQWIGGKILCGAGTSDNLTGLQWAINPDGDINTTDDMPDIINNSWYDPGISDDCESAYVDVETALEAAGIASVFSAGNAGPDPKTITPPHNINLNLVNSFTIGALNGNSIALPIADFSSRGPSKCGGIGSLLIKPEVSAPGVNVRSCTYNKEYALKSGTSMASPHTCGAILLLKEAFPYLSGFDLKMALYNTCTDLGEPGEDNIFGMGIINVWAAYNYLIGQGNTPVDPHRKNDLILIDVDVHPYQCEQTLRSIAHIENAGTDTVFNFNLQLTITNKLGVPTDFNQIWNGVLAPKQRLVLGVDPVMAETGTSTIQFEIVKVNNVNDDGPRNNRVRKTVTIVSNPVQTVAFKAGNDVKLCEGTKVELVSSFDKPGRVDWYNALTNGNKLGSGNPFLFGPITKTDTVYMQSIFTDFLGRKDIGNTVIENTLKPFGGLRMTVDYPFLLKSVKVYNTTKGVRKIELYKDYTMLFSKSITLTTIGENTIVLNFPVPTGDNISIMLSDDFKPLAPSKDQSAFPYSISNVVSIDGNSGPNNFGYNYFYDWHIEYDDFCERAQLVVPFINSQLSAGFAVPDTSYIVNSLGANILFVDTSINATTRDWVFSNGTTSSLTQPLIHFQNDGSYSAKLTVSNGAGCYDTHLKDFLVLPDTTTSTISPNFKTSFSIYPNPVKSKVYLQSKSILTSKSKLSIVNMNGIELYNQTLLSGAKSWEIDVSKLVKGVYMLKILDGNKMYVTKFITQ